MQLLIASGANERGAMTTSSSLHAGDTGRRPFAVFARLATVSIGLVNLAFLAIQNGVDDAMRRGDVTWNNALPVVLAVVVAGLVTSEITLRRLEPFGEEFFHRYRIMVLALGLGGMLTGGMVTAALALNGALLIEPATLLVRVAAALLFGLVDGASGAVLGLLEGLILAFPLAAILGRFRNTN